MKLQLKSGVEHCDDGTFQAQIKDENAKTVSGNWHWFGGFLDDKEEAESELENAIELVRYVCAKLGHEVEFERLTGDVKYHK